MISKFQFITQGDIEGVSHSQLAENACRGGCDWVQLRMKNVSDQAWLSEGLATQKVCKEYNSTFIINDNVLLAKEINADGVHLGKTDMSPVEARIILGEGFLIGGTANNLNDVKNLVKAQVDYIGLGPYRFTATKENLSPVLSQSDFLEIVKYLESISSSIPVVAIGGILVDDIKSILKMGIYGVAVASVVSKSQNSVIITSQFIQEIQKTVV